MNTTIPQILPADDGDIAAGAVVASNASRFASAHYSEPLTAYTVGWRDPENLSELLDAIAPPIQVGRRFEFRKADNAEAFYSETDDVRAIGAAFKRVEYSGQMVNAKTLNKGLTIRVDHDDVAGDDWQERYVQILMQRLLRNELRRAVSALDTAATNEPVVWDATANPDADVRSALIAAADSSGIRPNRVLFGEGAWALRADAYDTQNNAAAYRWASFSPAELAQRLFVEDVRVVGARYQSGASAKSGIVGDAVYFFFAQNILAKDEPSNLKRFVTPADGGSSFRVYLDEHAKYTDLSVEHYSSIVATSSAGVRKLTVSAS